MTGQAGVAAGVAGLLAAAAFLGGRWLQVRRAGRVGPLFARYEPPAGLSAAAVRFLERMECDSRCFAACLLGLGARGCLIVGEAVGEAVGQAGQAGETGFVLQRTISPAPAWFIGESQVVAALFEAGDRLEPGAGPEPALVRAGKALRDELEHAYAGVLFERHRDAIARAAAIGGVGVVAAALLDAPAAAIFLSAAVLMVMVGFAWRRLPGYTPAGRKARDEIDGLRQYLGAGEPDAQTALAWVKAPDPTPAECARLLPYAFALDVVRHWAGRLEGAHGAASVAAAIASYYPFVDARGMTSVPALTASLAAFSRAIGGAASMSPTPGDENAQPDQADGHGRT
jgi:predicted membrane protein DUF2207